MGASDRPPRWQVPRPAASTRYLLDTARSHGIAAQACLAGTGLCAGDLDDPGAVVLPEQELRVVRNLLAHGGDQRELGVETGLRYSLTSTGLLGYALLASATLREAIAVLSRYTVLLSLFFEVSYTETSAGLVVRVHDGDVPPDVRPFLLARDLVAGFRISTLLLSPAVLELIGTLDRPIPLEFRGFQHGDRGGADAAAWVRAARELVAPYGVTLDIDLDATRDAFTIPRELLDQAMPAPDPFTAALVLRQCEELLDQRSRFTGMAARVRHLLVRDPARMPTMAAAARALDVSERTLHRRLTEEGTTFRALVNAVRETLADELLADGLTVETVARHLGYADAAAFTHAYRRWHGYPPGQAVRDVGEKASGP
ncbi:AraC family transcriptional regulator ligand-binding domain-containing protein [Nocardia sp. NPDC050406]|uniref:AraC family transcriptional regulator n=1 Tax=Nocardia sp. NPDC050406 TaxID=3364318 RepID=UPI00379D7CDA